MRLSIYVMRRATSYRITKKSFNPPRNRSRAIVPLALFNAAASSATVETGRRLTATITSPARKPDCAAALVCTGPFAKQDAVAHFDVEVDQLAAVIAGARTNGDDLALLGLFFHRVWDDNAACRLFLGFSAADQNSVVQWTERHGVLLVDKQV
jgi:hypothetical protein